MINKPHWFHTVYNAKQTSLPLSFVKSLSLSLACKLYLNLFQQLNTHVETCLQPFPGCMTKSARPCASACFCVYTLFAFPQLASCPSCLHHFHRATHLLAPPLLSSHSPLLSSLSVKSKNLHTQNALHETTHALLHRECGNLSQSTSHIPWLPTGTLQKTISHTRTGDCWQILFSYVRLLFILPVIYLNLNLHS